MPVAELLARVGSFEIAEWIAELTLRSEEEKAAMDAAKGPQGPQTFRGTG